MTPEQINKIVSLRKSGMGYGAIASEIGLSKSTISSFCKKHDLTDIVVGKDLINMPIRGNTVRERSLENKRLNPFKVTVSFAEKPNYDAVAEALQILTNVR